MIIQKPFLTDFRHHHAFENCFTKEECEFISSLAWKWQDGLTANNPHRDKHVRDSDVFWLEQKQDIMWIWDRLRAHIEDANSGIWRFNLEGFHENIQLTRYTKEGHYDWHTDNGNGYSSFRKLSCVLNLSDSNEYVGGGTSIRVDSKSELLPHDQGTLNIFPSYVLHKAKRVKEGVRKTLVCWVGGEPYR